jgi:DNA repair protein RadC
MCNECESSEPDSDRAADGGFTAKNRRRFTYRVRELLVSYRPARDARGQVVRIPADRIAHASQAVAMLAPLVAGQVVETVGVACLSTRHECLTWHVVSRGDRNSASISIADLLVPGCLTPGATALIVVHNHPSGDPTPSPEDIALTRTLERGAALLGFSLLDHLVIGDAGSYYSFRETGLIKQSRRR